MRANYDEKTIQRRLAELRSGERTPLMASKYYRDCLERIREANRTVRRLHFQVKRGITSAELELEDAKIDRSNILAERDQLEYEAAVQAAGLALHKRGLRPGDWGIRKSAVVNNRQTYTHKANLPMQVIARQAEKILRRRCSKTLDRETIANVLRNTLSRKSKMGVVRVDVKSYFDTISHNQLRKMLAGNKQVDPVTFRIVDTLLTSFNEVGPGRRRGVPTGMPLSNVLADLYLSEMDSELTMREGVIFYARYVDDIIAVTFDASKTEDLFNQIKNRLHNLKLEINESKSAWWETEKGKIVESSDPSSGQEGDDFQLSYLGYLYSNTNGVKVDMTIKRKRKIELRMEQAYGAWNKSRIGRPKPKQKASADGLLVKRMRILCGNYRLWGAKSNAKAGIYFSNSAISYDAASLFELDQLHANLIQRYSGKMSAGLKKELEQISYVEGFRRRKYEGITRRSSRLVFSVWR